RRDSVWRGRHAVERPKVVGPVLECDVRGSVIPGQVVALLERQNECLPVGTSAQTFNVVLANDVIQLDRRLTDGANHAHVRRKLPYALERRDKVQVHKTLTV